MLAGGVKSVASYRVLGGLMDGEETKPKSWPNKGVSDQRRTGSLWEEVLLAG